ncbi:AAA family ATPase [bacterium]|nr:AAA family ATPase [bacterium]
MQLISVESAAFGTLSITKPLAFGPGLNILVAPNQAGKSTLITLIEWALYGVPPSKSKRNQAEVKRWSPWDGTLPQATLKLAPQLPNWPALVNLKIDFADFAPRATAATALTDLGEKGLFELDRNGSWDIGARLTGLSRGAAQASLIAHQGQLTNLLNLPNNPDHEGLRGLLTADLANRVEDPERATLDAALRQLDKPSFRLGELSKNPVQVGSLLREATNHWQMATAEVDTQRERYAELEELLAQRDEKEIALAKVKARLSDLVDEQGRLELAAAHWRYARVSQLHTAVASWNPQLEQEPWLADFPADVQRTVDRWETERSGLRERINASAGQLREAEALKLRAPYVEKVHIETEQEMIRYAERLRNARSEIQDHAGRHQQSQSRVQEIEAYLTKHEGLAMQADKLAELIEQQAALVAASKDRRAADKEVREYGEGRDETERKRLEQLKGVIKPYQALLPEIAGYIERRDRLRAELAEAARQRAELKPALEAKGMPLFASAGIVLVVALIGLFFLLSVQPVVAILVVCVLVAVAGWLGYQGFLKNQHAAKAQQKIKEELEPLEAEITGHQKMLDEHVIEIRREFEVAANIWDHVVEVLPEYQRLRTSLESYHQALSARDSATERYNAAWERIRIICMDTPAAADLDWVDKRIRLLRSYGEQRRQRIDEYSKLRDEQNTLERLRRDEEDMLARLKRELEPLGLGPQLEKDESGAIEYFQSMVAETRQYKQLLREAKEVEALKAHEDEMLAKLKELLAPLGLAELAEQDPPAALREFELRRERARAYQDTLRQLEEAEDQLRHIQLEYDEYTARWQAASPAEREGLEALVRTEADYDEAAERRRVLQAEIERSQRQVDQQLAEVVRLRERVVKDEDVRDTLEAAILAEARAKRDLAAVRNWQRALELLTEVFGGVLSELSSRLAPQLTEELERVLAAAPVAGVRRAGLSGRLELLLEVDGAPAGLSGDEVIGRLSLGAQMQLALALRVAVAGALSDKSPAPLLLDEPLAELDDDRAVDCLRYLGRLAKHHQILMTTCHTQHHGWLAKKAGIEANVLTLG